jgi:hypothetical protein
MLLALRASSYKRQLRPAKNVLATARPVFPRASVPAAKTVPFSMRDLASSNAQLLRSRSSQALSRSARNVRATASAAKVM